jgi:hypothetical protein
MARRDRPALGGVPGRLPMLVSSALVVVVAAAVVALTRTPGDVAGPVTATQVGSLQLGPSVASGRPPVAAVVARVLRVPEITGAGRAPVLVGLDASGSTDPDGDSLTYRWDLDAVGRPDDATRSDPRVRLTGRAPAVVTVVVDDGTGHRDTARMRLPRGPQR